MKGIKIILAVTFVAILAACSEYNQILKSDDYVKKYETANALYDEGKYDRSIALYEQVYQRFPKQQEGEVSYFRIGKGYYYSGDFYMAGYFLGAFTQRFPFSPKVEEATFLAAMCSVNESPKSSLDQTSTEIAINDLQTFTERFPESTYIDSCNLIIDNLRFKIETKEYDAAMLYAKTEQYRAAVTSCNEFVKNYPVSIYKEEVYYTLVKNSYLLAKNSVDSKKMERSNDTMERYRNFVAEFPESKYKKELTPLYEDMGKWIEAQEPEKK